MKFLADILASIGAGVANIGTQGCVILFVDEPKMPRSLIEK